MDAYNDHPVRPYILTSGRAYPSRNTIRPETLLVVDPDAPHPVTASRQQRELLEMCGGMLSLAEVAAHMGLAVSLVVVIASDLVVTGHLQVRSAPRHMPPSTELLEKVLDGLRKL